MFEILFITTYFVSYTYENNTQTNTTQANNTETNKTQWKFEDFLKKYEPRIIWEQIDKQKKILGRNISNKEQTEIMIRGMDTTDDLLNFRIQNGDPKIILAKDTRRGWKYPGKFNKNPADKFYLRQRLFELMKQAIYQARDKMTVMQKLREQFSRSALYRMGFLFNKADNAAKTFSVYSFRAFRTCLLTREEIYQRMTLYDVLTTNERQLNLWFNVELIVDLIMKNDEMCKEMFKNQSTERFAAFNDTFEP